MTETEKKAVLVVSFGTTCEESRRDAIGGIERALGCAFPDREVRRAFTSGFIIRRILKNTGEKIDTVQEALDRALSDGIADLLVQPTHFMKGIEYDEMCKVVEQYRGHFERLALAEPLLVSDDDYCAVTEAIAGGTGGLVHEGRLTGEESAKKSTQDSPTAQGEAVILMGHGSSKEDANSVYETLQRTFADSGYANYHIALVEARPSVDDIMQAIKGKGYRHIILRPLMVVAGDHARNDMAGEDPDCWKAKLERAGYQVTAILHGLGEDPAIQKIYVEHAKSLLI